MPLRAPAPTLTSTPGIHPNAAGLSLTAPVPLFSGVISPAYGGISLAALAPVLAPSGVLGIGGNDGLRGPKSYAPLLNPVVVQAPYGSAQVAAAMVAAGVGGKVLLPHAGSPYNFGFDLTVASQVWQQEQVNTTVLGDIGVRAPNLSFQGGIARRFWADAGSAACPNFTARDIFLEQLRLGDLSVFTLDNMDKNGPANWLISQCRFLDNGPTSTNPNGAGGNFRSFLRMTYSPGTGDGMRIEHCIVDRAAGHGGDTMSGSDNPGELGSLKNFVVHNCRLDGGLAVVPSSNPSFTRADGYFGIEVWSAIPNAAGRGSIVQYSDLRGGSDVLMSMVRSQNNWIHHNKMTIGQPASVGAQQGRPFATYESAGSTETGLVFEYNQVIGNGARLDGGKSGAMMYHNSGAHDQLLQLNKFSDFDTVLSPHGFSAGGGYTIKDNCVSNFNGIVQADSSWGVANVITNNTSNACGY